MKYLFFVCLIVSIVFSGCYLIYPIPVQPEMEILVPLPVDAIYENLEIFFTDTAIPAEIVEVYDYYSPFEEPLYDELIAQRSKLAKVIVPEGIPPVTELSLYFIVVDKVIRDVVFINLPYEERECDPGVLIEKYRERFSHSPLTPQFREFLESRGLSRK